MICSESLKDETNLYNKTRRKLMSALDWPEAMAIIGVAFAGAAAMWAIAWGDAQK